MKTYQLTLPDEFAEVVDRLVEEGKFEDVDHLVLHAISRVEDDARADSETDDEELRRKLQLGIDQLDRGERIDGPQFMDELISELLQRATKPASTP